VAWLNSRKLKLSKKKSILEEIGGFDASLIAGEEPEMCQRIRKKGYEIFYINSLMAYHDLNMTQFYQYWTRSFRTGYAYAKISENSRDFYEPLWKEESIHNIKKTITMLFITLILPALSISLGDWTPFFLMLFFCSGLILNTAKQNLSRCENISTSILYGIHSHLQHFPIFLGQVSFFMEKLTRKSRTLIEYK